MDNKSRTILLVDDDYDLATQMKMWLEADGYNVLYAENEKEAGEYIEEGNFDLALLDLMMENKDSGFILSHKIKRKNSSIPVIIVTAVTKETGFQFDLNSVEEHSWIKADAIISKGIRPEQLKGEVKKFLEG